LSEGSPGEESSTVINQHVFHFPKKKHVFH
jgi:hypothetical protein